MTNKQAPHLIRGDIFKDRRGSIAFANDFDMSVVKRFYTISPKNPSIIRAWQGHQFEQKWFNAVNGKFVVRLIEIDNWQQPNRSLPFLEFVLTASDHQVLYIPRGYVNGFRALENDSTLLVFSDVSTEDSVKDDYRFSHNYWFDWNIK